MLRLNRIGLLRGFHVNIKQAPKTLIKSADSRPSDERLLHMFCVEIKGAPKTLIRNHQSENITESVSISPHDEALIAGESDQVNDDSFVNVMQYQAKASYDGEVNSSMEDDELYRGIDIMLTAHSPQILDSFGKFISLVAAEFAELGVEFDGYTTPRVHKDKWITNKAPFKYGRHKVEYEVRTYKKVVHLLYLTGSTRKVMLNYIERNVPAGVGIEVRSFRLAPLPDQIKQHVTASYQHLDDADHEYAAAAFQRDTMESRKLKTDAFEARRQPWNMNQHDREKEEIMAFRRQWRQPMTVGRI